MTSVSCSLSIRICPRRFLADVSVWIKMAKLLATYNGLPPIGADGKKYIPKIEMTPGLVRSILSHQT